MVLYPEGIWYTKLTAETIPEIVASHLRNGKQVTRLLREDAAAMKAEILDHRNKYLEMLKRKAAEAAAQQECPKETVAAGN
jgi:hypothetical protein